MEFNEFRDELNKFCDELDESILEENPDNIYLPENKSLDDEFNETIRQILIESREEDKLSLFDETISQMLIESREEDKLSLLDNMADEVNKNVRRIKL